MRFLCVRCNIEFLSYVRCYVKKELKHDKTVGLAWTEYRAQTVFGNLSNDKLRREPDGSMTAWNRPIEGIRTCHNCKKGNNLTEYGLHT